MAEAPDPFFTELLQERAQTRSGSRLSRGTALVAILLALRDKMERQEITRDDLEGKRYEELVEIRKSKAWVDAAEIISYTGLKSSTLYRDLNVLISAGAVESHRTEHRDPIGRRLKRTQFRLVWNTEPPIVPEVTRTWFEVDGKEYAMVDQWFDGSAPAVTNWALVSAEELDSSVEFLKGLVLMHYLSRLSHRWGSSSISSVYEEVLGRQCKVLEDIDSLLDALEAGRDIRFKCRGVRTGSAPAPFQIERSLRVSPTELESAREYAERVWFHELVGRGYFGP